MSDLELLPNMVDLTQRQVPTLQQLLTRIVKWPPAIFFLLKRLKQKTFDVNFLHDFLEALQQFAWFLCCTKKHLLKPYARLENILRLSQLNLLCINKFAYNLWLQITKCFNIEDSFILRSLQYRNEILHNKRICHTVSSIFNLWLPLWKYRAEWEREKKTKLGNTRVWSIANLRMDNRASRRPSTTTTTPTATASPPTTTCNSKWTTSPARTSQ